MAAYASLLSQIPIPQQQWQTQGNTPPVASVNVGEVQPLTPKVNDSKLDSFLEKIKLVILKKRLAKLESIPVEKRTAVQQAEIDANKKTLDYMV